MKRLIALLVLFALPAFAATESPRARSTSGAWICVSGNCEIGATTYDKLTILGPTGDANFVVPNDAIGADELAPGAVDATAIGTGTVTTTEILDDTVGPADINGATVCGAMYYASANPTEAGATDDFMSMWDHAGSTTEANEDEMLQNGALLTFHSLYCTVDVAPGVGNDAYTITVRDDGADTAVTCDIDETATTCNSAALSEAVVAGSAVNFDISSDTGGGTDPDAAALLTCTVCVGQ